MTRATQRIRLNEIGRGERHRPGSGGLWCEDSRPDDLCSARGLLIGLGLALAFWGSLGLALCHLGSLTVQAFGG